MPDALPGSLWTRIQRDPVRAPEHIALAAAKRFAPAAQRWAARGDPGLAPSEHARLAVRRHVRAAWIEGAVTGLGGGLTAVADLAALAWIQSRMVYFIAAAYGFDPHHPMRPAELLALQGVYETPADARAALDGLGKPLALQLIASRARREKALASRLVKFVGRQVASRATPRLIPVLSAPLSATQNGRATAALARRALVYYGGEQALAGDGSQARP